MSPSLPVSVPKDVLASFFLSLSLVDPTFRAWADLLARFHSAVSGHSVGYCYHQIRVSFVRLFLERIAGDFYSFFPPPGTILSASDRVDVGLRYVRYLFLLSWLEDTSLSYEDALPILAPLGAAFSQQYHFKKVSLAALLPGTKIQRRRRVRGPRSLPRLEPCPPSWLEAGSEPLPPHLHEPYRPGPPMTDDDLVRDQHGPVPVPSGPVDFPSTTPESSPPPSPILFDPVEDEFDSEFWNQNMDIDWGSGLGGFGAFE